MRKKIVNALKKIVVAFLILYGFNLLGSSINVYIPINVITISITSILGIPGLLSLIAIFFIVQ